MPLTIRVTKLFFPIAIILCCVAAGAQVVPVHPRPMPDAAQMGSLTKRANNNDLGAQAMLAAVLEHRGDYAEAAKWYTKAAHGGHVFAQNNLGVLYFLGLGVSADDSAALNWFRRAAVDGNAAAQNNLALMYASGRGVQADPASARRWLERSAANGFAAAQYQLGYLAEHGQGMPADAVQAAHWYALAAAQEWAAAQVNLALMYLDGRTGIRDEAKALRLLVAAAEQNCPEAEFDLSLLHLQGRVVSRDEDTAAYWARRASAHGFSAGASTVSPQETRPAILSALTADNGPIVANHASEAGAAQQP